MKALSRGRRGTKRQRNRGSGTPLTGPGLIGARAEMAFPNTKWMVAAGSALSAPDPSAKQEVYDPQGMLARLNRTFRRRLSDQVQDVFREACSAGDLDTAEELLTVLEKMHNRRKSLADERRYSDDAMVKAREELDRAVADSTRKRS